jgi:uncharacterized protein involved in outer membrane biogenesis
MIRRLIVPAIAILVAVVGVTAAALYWFLTGDASRLALERQATAWLGQPVRIGSLSASLVPRVSLRLRDVRAGEPVRVTLAEVDLSAPLGPLLSRRIEDATVTVADSRIDLPLPFSLPVTAPGGAPLSIRSIGLRNVILASRGREIQVSADASLAGTRLAITRFTAATGKTAIEASGTVELSPRIDATIKARAPDLLDADDLIAVAGAFATPGSAASSPPPRITAEIEAPYGSIAGVPIRRIAATLRADGNQVSIEPLSFSVLGGRQNGWLDVSFGDRLEMRLGLGFSNIDVAELATLSGAAGAITGRLAGSVRFGAAAPDLATALGSLRGAGEVVISNGTMRGLDLVGTVVRFLGRAPRAKAADGTSFDRIAGNFALSDGRVRSDDLTLHSSDFDIFARGTLQLDTDTLDGRAQVVLSEALSAQAGRDLYRYARTGTRIVLPGTVSGTLQQPRIGFDAAAAARQAIGNEIQRRLSDLLDVIRAR